jgi:hypothetical protein
MHVELDEWSLDALEPMHFASLDDEDVTGTGLELLAVDGPEAPSLLDELDLVIWMEVRVRTGPWLSVKQES